jgi:hypothetical protein
MREGGGNVRIIITYYKINCWKVYRFGTLHSHQADAIFFLTIQEKGEGQNPAP